MFSNHFDALALTEDDRRIWAIAGPHHIKDEEYYKTLYAGLQDDEWLSQAYWYLMNMNISSFNRAQRAPDFSGMRHKLITNSESSDDYAIRALLEDRPFRIATRSQIMRWADSAFPDDPVDSKAIRKILDNERLH